MSAARVARGSLAALQVLAAIRVFGRMLRTARGMRVERIEGPSAERVSVVVPVLDEERRLGACLDGLIASGDEVGEILVVDGGSRDRTAEIVAVYALRDERVRFISAAPVADGWNGKAWGLACGLHESDPRSPWILTVDADLRVDAALVRSLLAHAERTGDDAFSVATQQRLAGPLDALIHPALLTTLVYRFGLPGRRSRTIGEVQANGQCFLARRNALVRTDAFLAARASRCEDVTVARRLTASGYAVGFYEAANLATVTMYDGWRELVTNWPRSLPMRDGYTKVTSVVGLIEIALAQAMPLPIVALLALCGRDSALFPINGLLMLTRIATLVGTFRAYRRPAPTYWLSPLADVPAVVLLVASALQRRHTWRGRLLVEAAA